MHVQPQKNSVYLIYIWTWVLKMKQLQSTHCPSLLSPAYHHYLFHRQQLLFKKDNILYIAHKLKGKTVTWISYTFVYVGSWMRKSTAMQCICYRPNIFWLPKKEALWKHGIIFSLLLCVVAINQGRNCPQAALPVCCLHGSEASCCRFLIAAPADFVIAFKCMFKILNHSQITLPSLQLPRSSFYQVYISYMVGADFQCHLGMPSEGKNGKHAGLLGTAALWRRYERHCFGRHETKTIFPKGSKHWNSTLCLASL